MSGQHEISSLTSEEKRARRKHQYMTAIAPTPPAAKTRVAPMLASITRALSPKPGSVRPPHRKPPRKTSAYADNARS